MDALALFGFALACGITVTGLAATLLEIGSGRAISFSPPFTAPDRIIRSLGATLFAGPMMLFSDALEARRKGAIGQAAFLGCAIAGLAWSLALGVVALELATLAMAAAARLA